MTSKRCNQTYQSLFFPAMSNNLVFINPISARKIIPQDGIAWIEHMVPPTGRVRHDYDIWGIAKEPLSLTATSGIAQDNYDFSQPCRYDKLEDLVIAKSKQVLDQSKRTGKKIALFYSGGIDSTLLLAGLIATGDKDLYDSVVVFCSYESIVENYNLYEKFIRNKFQVQDSKSNYEILSQPGWLYLFGDPKAWHVKPAWINGLTVTGEQSMPMTYERWKFYWDLAYRDQPLACEWYWNFLKDYTPKFTQKTGKLIQSVIDYLWLVSSWTWLEHATDPIKYLLNLDTIDVDQNCILNLYTQPDVVQYVWKDMYNMTYGSIGEDQSYIRTVIGKLINVTWQMDVKYKKQSMGQLWHMRYQGHLAIDSNLKPVTDLAPYYNIDHDFKTLKLS